jgi:hypothetical protein
MYRNASRSLLLLNFLKLRHKFLNWNVERPGEQEDVMKLRVLFASLNGGDGHTGQAYARGKLSLREIP